MMRLGTHDNTKKRMLIAASLGLLLQSVTPALGQGADFYKGKQVDLYIGYSVGGGYDIYARILRVISASTCRVSRSSCRRTWKGRGA